MPIRFYIYVEKRANYYMVEHFRNEIDPVFCRHGSWRKSPVLIFSITSNMGMKHYINERSLLFHRAEVSECLILQETHSL